MEIGKTATFVNVTTTPSDDREFNDFDDTRAELREGIEHSREILRQSRELIGLAEGESPYTADGDTN
jgi:hypothetical protein